MSQTSLREHLKRLSGLVAEHHSQPTVYGHVHQHGREFTSEPLSREETRYIDTITWREHPPKLCSHNAQMAALTLPPQPGMVLKYTEGYILRNVPVPILHAWISLNGKLVDTTVRIGGESPLQRPMGATPNGWEYIGIEMDPKSCLHSLSHGQAISPLDGHLCRWPMLKATRTQIPTPTPNHYRAGKKMGFITGPLKTPTAGACAACGKDGQNLEAAVTKLAPNPRHNYANGAARPEGEQTFLICADCAKNHPAWRLEGHREVEQARN